MNYIIISRRFGALYSFKVAAEAREYMHKVQAESPDDTFTMQRWESLPATHA